MKTSKKSSRTLKRALAFAMSLALVMSTLAVSPSVDAASKKVPKLSVKKKTLYYNKTGKKTYTLKVKKNKVKKIKKTIWKTSKKSVVKLSKKKKTSVKLTAKKAGKATITATVKYTVKGSKKGKTKKLKCKVTVKKYVAPTATPKSTSGAVTATPTAEATSTATATATAQPGGNATPTATATVQPSEDPTPTPEAPAASKVVIEKPESATIGTVDGYNGLSLTAKVYDQFDNEMKDQTITWKSDDETIATVENGKVTGLKSGAALIYATVNDVESVASASIKVTVDGMAPVITKAEITDYANITVSLNEAIVAGDAAKVEVFKDGAATAMTGVTAALSEDGTSIVVHKDAFAAGTYKIVLTGYADKNGNAFAEGTNSVTKAKDASYVSKFIVDDTRTVPAMGANQATKVYFKVQDQYGQVVDFAQSGYTITAAAEIKETGLILNGVTVTDPGADEEGYVTLPKNSAMAKDKTVSITLTSTKNPVAPATTGTVIAEDTLEVVLADSTGFDTPTSFDAIVAIPNDDNDADSTSTAKAPVFKNSVITNGFTIGATLFNSFGYNEATGKVKYVIDNTDIITFDGGAKTITADNTAATAVTALHAGTATITATLDGNADVEGSLTIKILNPSLADITVAALEAGTNSEEKTAAVTLDPVDTTLTGADLTAVLVSESQVNSVKTLEIKDDTVSNVTTTNIHVAANANGKENTIKFVITNGTADDLTIDATAGTAAVKTASAEKGIVVSSVIEFTSTPSSAVKSIALKDFASTSGTLTAGDTAETTYSITNKYDEDITSMKDVADVKLTTSDDTVATVPANPAEKGKVTVTGVKAGTVVIAAAYDAFSTSTTVKVDEAKVIQTITLGTANAAHIYGDTTPAYVTIRAASQYNGVAYKLKAADFGTTITMTNTDLTVTPVAAKTGGGYETAAGDAEVVALAVEAATSVTADTAKEIKLEKAGTSTFAAATKAVTVRPQRASKIMAVSVASLTALTDVTSLATKLSIKDQYGDSFAVADKDADIKSEIKVVKSDGKLEDITTQIVTVTVGDYDTTNKVYPVTVEADTAATYQITLYTGDTLATTSPQAAFRFTAGTASSLVKMIEFTGYVGDKKLADVDYIKVDTDTSVVPGFQAKDANGNVIAGIDASLADVIWYYTPSADFAASAENQTVSASGSEKSGTVKIKAVYGDASDEITVKVSNTAPKAKAGTYKIYDKNEVVTAPATSKTDIKAGSVRFQVDGTATLEVHATDQYGDDYEVTGFYGIDSSDESFATAEQTPGTNEIVITKAPAAKAGKANISVYITETLKYTINATAIDDLNVTLTSANCVGQGWGQTPTVTVTDGVASVGVIGYNQGIKVSIKLPNDVTVKDYSGISFVATSLDSDAIGMDDGTYNKFTLEMRNTVKESQYIQGPGSGQNVVVGSYAKLGEISTSGTTFKINFDWTQSDVSTLNEDELKAGATITFVLGVTGKNNVNYSVSELKLLG